MKLNEEQERVVNATENKIVVIASSGSGKTVCLVERAKRLLNEENDPSKIVLLTYTNAAASEIKQRIGDYKNMFIGTIHSYANFLLVKNGINTEEEIKNKNYDKLFTKVLSNPDVIQEVNHLLLDEAQDSSPIQYDFILNVIKPKNWFMVGDYRQVIYEFNKVDPYMLLNLSKSPGVTKYELIHNYRTSQKILKKAKNTIAMLGYEYYDNSIGVRTEEGRIIEVQYNINAIARDIPKCGEFKDWFILCRTNSQVNNVINGLKQHNIPCDTFKRAELDSDEFLERMATNTVKVLTSHSAKGLENKYVIVVGALWHTDEEVRLNYVSITRAKDMVVWTVEQPNKKRYREKIMVSDF